MSFIFILASAFAQQIKVTGTITSKADGLTLIGATVMEKGTSNGTITDFDGNYSLTVNKGATLVVSYVGMLTKEVVVKNELLDIILDADAEILEEIVVTAMGVKAEKKKLNFAVQSIAGDNITENRSANFVSGLQGKISGVSVTNAGGSPNAGSQIILRGVSSINQSQNNEPMFILDGMPLSGGATSMADINPNDIESLTVLKGAAASALYGQEAANGVIMITTKSAAEGKVNVNFNAAIQTDIPTRLVETQSMYAPGALGFYKEQTSGGWGPKLPEGADIYDNVKNYFQNGFYHNYDVSVSGGTEKFQAYGSASFSDYNGIVPNDYKQKVGFLVKGTYNIAKNLSVTFLANVTNNTYRSAGSDLNKVYSWPITDDITNYADKDGNPRFRYLDENIKYNSPVSPLWNRYMNSGKNNSMRNLIMGSVKYEPVKNLVLTGRVSYDGNYYTYDGYSAPLFSSSNLLADDVSLDVYNSVPGLRPSDVNNINSKNELRYLLGDYSYNTSRRGLLTASAVATYKIELPKKWSIDLLAGGEIREIKSEASSIYGSNFIIPGVYSIENAGNHTADDYSLSHTHKRTFGWYGEVRADYNSVATLSVTGRWDWSSTIDNQYLPYFYPSITGGLVFSELFDIANDWFSFGKLRGNWAMVGKDAPLYLNDYKYKQFPTFPDGGYGVDPTTSVGSNLKPEISTSWEVGLDLRFFLGRTRLDVAYYNTTVRNQIITVRVTPTSGNILQTRNEGDIQNQGLELTFEQDIIKNADFQWTASLNFGLNRGKLLYLPDNITETPGVQYGDMYGRPYVGGSLTAILGKDYLRNDAGEVVVGEDGYPIISPTKAVPIGDREADFNAGLSTSLRWKGLGFSMLWDGRLGGDVANITSRGLLGNGMHKALETYRGRQVVFDGVVDNGDGTYSPNSTPITMDYNTVSNYIYAVSSNFIEDGSFVRLAYVTLSYDFASLTNRKVVKDLSLSFTANNLLLFTKYTGSDPIINASTSSMGTGAAGFDNYAVPSTRSFNFALKLKF